MYEGVSLTDNIEKHAGAPLYELDAKHPHPLYKDKSRLIIDEIFDEELLKLFNKHKKELEQIGSKQNPLDLIKVKDLTCPCDHKLLYEQIFGDPIDQVDEVMAYKSCKHTIYAAAKRQMKAAATPNPKVADEFLAYAKSKIDEELGEYLKDFGYSFQQWYNHLELKKQNDMDLVIRYLNGDQNLTKSQLRTVLQENYEGICKVELQETNGKPRMVCSIPKLTKYVMGPITWALEEIAEKHFNGYCGGKNLGEMAKEINAWASKGFTKVVQGDGHAFDNSQDITLKRVDQYLYSRIREKVYHVDTEIFDKIYQQEYKIMDVVYTDKDSKQQKNLFRYKILGSVFSGDADTTLCNTMRMALYNRFVNDKAGLKWGKDYVCFAKGDDFYCLYQPEIRDDFIKANYYKYFLPENPNPKKPDTRVYGLGQILKMLEFGELKDLAFCSLRAWYKAPNQIILTRNPKKFYGLSKYARKTKNLPPHKLAQYLLQQAIALDESYKGIKIFDTMAEMYRTKAKSILSYCPNHKYEDIKNKAKLAMIKDSRRPCSPYTYKENDEFKNLLYNIKERRKYYKVMGSYWETMKRIEEQTDYSNLSPHELELINQQIEAEFSSEELKSVLGHKN